MSESTNCDAIHSHGYTTHAVRSSRDKRQAGRNTNLDGNLRHFPCKRRSCVSDNTVIPRMPLLQKVQKIHHLRGKTWRKTLHISLSSYVDAAETGHPVRCAVTRTLACGTGAAGSRAVAMNARGSTERATSRMCERFRFIQRLP